MQYMRGWRALRQDPDWKRKIGVASLLFLSSAIIPIFGQLVVLGWLTLAMRRAAQGQDAPLPDLRLDFDYMMKLLNVGLKPFVARLVWTFPAMMGVMVLMVCAGAGMSFAMAASRDPGEPPSTVLPLLLMGGAYLGAFGMIMVAQIFANSAVMRAEVMGEIGPAIRVGEVLRTTRLLAKELIVGHIVLGFVGAALAFAGMLACYFGMFVTMTVFMVISSYYNAELYRRYLEKGGQPLPVAALDVEGATVPQPNAY
jgi:hypothetical protein